MNRILIMCEGPNEKKIIDILLEKFGYIGVCSIMPIGWIVGFSIMFAAYIYEKKRLAIF